MSALLICRPCASDPEEQGRPNDQREQEGGQYGPDHLGDNGTSHATLVGQRRAMENGCGGETSGLGSVSYQVMSTPLSIVIAIGGSRGIEWETRQSSLLHFASRRRHLHALQGAYGYGVLLGP